MSKESPVGFVRPAMQTRQTRRKPVRAACSRGKEFCRFHHILYEPVVMPGQPLYRPPILEDSASVQVVIMQVIRELMRQPIDRHNAGLILYGLQLASSNLARFRELYPPPPPHEEEDESRPSLAGELLAALREDLAKATAPAQRPSSVSKNSPSPNHSPTAHRCCAAGAGCPIQAFCSA